MPRRKYAFDDTYRYGFNGKENDNDIAIDNYDFGERIYDGRLSRWLSIDPLQSKYPELTPYNFVADCPITAIDPDGKLIIFIGGLRLWVASGDQRAGNRTRKSSGGIYSKYDRDGGLLRSYWRAKQNSFGRESNIDLSIMFKPPKGQRGVVVAGTRN